MAQTITSGQLIAIRGKIATILVILLSQSFDSFEVVDEYPIVYAESTLHTVERMQVLCSQACLQ